MVTSAMKLKDVAPGKKSYDQKKKKKKRKVMTNLGSILKSRAITLRTKVHLVKAMVFPVVIDRCERTIKKSES